METVKVTIILFVFLLRVHVSLENRFEISFCGYSLLIVLQEKKEFLWYRVPMAAPAFFHRRAILFAVFKKGP